MNTTLSTSDVDTTPTTTPSDVHSQSHSVSALALMASLLTGGEISIIVCQISKSDGRHIIEQISGAPIDRETRDKINDAVTTAVNNTDGPTTMSFAIRTRTRLPFSPFSIQEVDEQPAPPPPQRQRREHTPISDTRDANHAYDVQYRMKKLANRYEVGRHRSGAAGKHGGRR